MKNQTIVNSGLEIMQKLKEIGSHEAQVREEIRQEVRQEVLRERPAAERPTAPVTEPWQNAKKIIENKKIPAPIPTPKPLKEKQVQKHTKKITVNHRW